MHRAQKYPHDLVEDLENDQIIDASIHEQGQQPMRQALDEELLWMLLLAAVSECVTTCFVPGYSLLSSGLNVSGTALNWIGPFLDGATYGYEDQLHGAEMPLACVHFRSAFLGVFTSFSFMVDHAGDLSGISFGAGPIYICISTLGGCCFFYLGYQVAFAKWIKPLAGYASKALHKIVHKVSLLKSLVTFVGVTTLRAALGSHGFVRDPKDPQFIGRLPVADGEELLLGIFMSCSAVLLSNYVSTFFPREPPQLRNAASPGGGPFIDWGCLCCNLLASFLAGLAYQLSRILSSDMTKTLLAMKFVSSFCGSLSGFSASISIIMRFWMAGNRHSALWNLALQLLVGLLVMPYLYKNEAV
ncbi:hypothetical protein CCR75_008867 [Bremia lactucae]|uniref:Uncharacterized protein n=1 Tax=Bremia lactucae TaxID=4779 RepID=A0A976IAU0_BRELC|nr:hypothetical protein CCR75_008867 [Bremia lactucae]